MKDQVVERACIISNFLLRDLSRVWRAGAVHIGASRWLTQAIRIVQRILLARILGATNIGHIAVVRSSLALLQLPAGAGILTATKKFTAESSGNDVEQANVLSTGFWFVACTSCVVASIMLVVLRTTSIISDEVARDILSVLVFALPLMVLSQLLISVLAGCQRMRLIAKTGALLSLGGFLTAVSLSYFWGIRGWLGNRVGWAIVGFCIYLFVLGGRIPIRWDGHLLHRMFRIGLFAFLGQAVGTILLQFDTLCISGIMKDAEATGIYNTAAMAYQQLMSVVGGVLYTVFPYVAKNHRDLPRLRRRHKELTIKLGGISVLAGLVAWWVAPWFFLLFGAKFAASVAPFRILVVGFLFQVQSVLSNTYMDALGRTDIHLYVGLLAMSSNILLNLLFIPKWGIIGAAWATVISLAFSLLVREAVLHYFIFYKEAIR